MWAITVVGFFMFSRLSNLLPSTKNFDVAKQLKKSHVKVASDCVIINTSWSKVIQLQDRIVSTPLKAIPGSVICPKWSLVRACRLSKSSDSDHLFAYWSNGQVKVILQSEYISFLRKKLKKCGLNPQLYSGHSLRRGGATWAFRSGVPTELIKHHGDWASDSYMLYLDFTLGDKLKTTWFMS